MVYEPQGHLRPDLLPSFVGFETALHYDDVGMVRACGGWVAWQPAAAAVHGPCPGGHWRVFGQL